MKRQPRQFIDVVLRAGPDLCLAAVCLHIIGASLELQWLQFIGMCVLTWPVGYVVAHYVTRWMFGDE